MRQCMIVDCDAPGVDRDLCPRHAHYFRVVLADPWYRNHPVPDIDAPQLALRYGVKPDGTQVAMTLEAQQMEISAARRGKETPK